MFLNWKYQRGNFECLFNSLLFWIKGAHTFCMHDIQGVTKVQMQTCSDDKATKILRTFYLFLN